MAGTSWPSLQAGKKARASDVESKFDWIEGDFVPMIGGNTTNGAYDLGTTTAQWKNAYLSNGIMVGGSTTPVSPIEVVKTNSVSVNLFCTLEQTNAFTLIQGIVGNGGTTQTTTSLFGRMIFNITDVDPNPLKGEIIFSVNTGDTISNGLTITDEAKVQFASGSAVNQISIDGTFSDNSDNIVPTQKATKTYFDQNRGISDQTATTALLGNAGGYATIGALSLSSDGLKYSFFATIRYTVPSNTANIVSFIGEISDTEITVGSAVPAISFDTFYASSTSYTRTVHIIGTMSVTAGGHTFEIKASINSASWLSSAYSFIISKG